MNARRIIAITAVAAGVALVPSVASAADHSAPGTPGQPGCVGQTTAYLSQGAGGELDAHGLGNLSDLAGLSVKDIHAIVEQYCAG